MKLHTLAAICADTLRPLSPSDLRKRDARRAQIKAEMARVAKSSEACLPPDQQRQVIDLRELRRAATECAVACAVATPVAVGVVFWQMTQIY